MTLYELLEVDPHASQREIKKAYRRLAKRYHPDKNPGDAEAEERFKEIADAYRVLSNRRKRAAYDRGQTQPATDVPPSPGSEPPRGRWRPRDPDRFRFRRVPAFDPRDAQLGALFAVSLTLAASAGEETITVVRVMLSSLVLGGFVSVPPYLALRRESLFVRSASGMLAPFVAAAGAVVGSMLAGLTPTWGASGIWFAFVGGAGGALVAGTFSRTFRDALGHTSGVLMGGLIGAALGAGFGGFMWYWSSVFRWLEHPPRDDLSVVASVGVVGAVLGAAAAAAVAGARSPTQV